MLTRNPRLTAAGLALFTNQAPGFSVSVTHIALGSAVYDPVGDELALKSEFARFPIATGADISPSQIQVGALVTNADPAARSTSNKYIGEIGFYVGATLLAVLSQSDRALFYKSPDLDVPISYILDFSTLPPGSLTVGAPGLSDSLQLAAQTAQAEAAAARNASNEAKAIRESVTADVSGYVSDYPALRGYVGPVKRVYVTGVLGTTAPTGVAGEFILDESDTVSGDNGGTIIVGPGSKRWKRVIAAGISAMWFGAFGDGIASDTTPMQTAMNYATSVGRVLELGGKTYNCKSAKLAANCHIDGSGGTIKGQLEIGLSNLHMRNVRLIASAALYGIYLHGSSGAHLRNITLDNVRVEFDPSTTVEFRLGLSADYIDNLRVINSYIPYGIQLIGCKDYLIEGNTLDGDNFQNNNELIHASYNSHGIINNNTFLNSLDNFIDLYSSGARTVVSNNRMVGCKTRLGTVIEIKVSLTDNPANTSSDESGWTEQIIISNNYIGDITPYAAQNTAVFNIYHIDSRAVPMANNWAKSPRNIIISNNIIDGYDESAVGNATFQGFALIKLWGIIVSGNIVRNIKNDSADGIASAFWTEDCHDIALIGNKGCVNGGSGMSFHGNCYDIRVHGNDLGRDENAGHINYFGLYFAKIGSRAAFSGKNFTITGNILHATMAGIQQPYSAGVITDSIASGNIIHQQVLLENAGRFTFANNWVYGDRFYVMRLGSLTAVSAHNKVMGNTFNSPSATQKNGLELYRNRAGIYTQNTFHTCSYSILLAGSGTAGECDALIIKDNIAVSQVGANFPFYSSVNAADQASIMADTNIKTT